MTPSSFLSPRKDAASSASSCGSSIRRRRGRRTTKMPAAIASAAAVLLLLLLLSSSSTSSSNSNRSSSSSNFFFISVEGSSKHNPRPSPPQRCGSGYRAASARASAGCSRRGASSSSPFHRLSTVIEGQRLQQQPQRPTTTHRSLSASGASSFSSSSSGDNAGEETVINFFEFPSSPSPPATTTTRGVFSSSEDPQAPAQENLSYSSSVAAIVRDDAKRTQQQQQQKRPSAAATIHQHHRRSGFVVMLMGISGFAEGFCVRRYGVFPNLMTGTMIKAAEAASAMNWTKLAFSISMLSSYAAGGSIFSVWWKKNRIKTETDEDEKRRRLLRGVSVLSTVFFVFSDVLGGGLVSTSKWLRCPLLATAFGIVNAGTIEAGAGVTFAMTGHVTKVATESFGGSSSHDDRNHHKNNNNAAAGRVLLERLLRSRAGSSGSGDNAVAGGSAVVGREKPPPAAHRTSAKGLASFWVSALAANALCGVLASSTTTTMATPGVFFGGSVLRRFPSLLGTFVALSYALAFRWYARATTAAAEGGEAANP